MKTIRLDGVIGTAKGEISSNWFAAQLPTDGSEIEVKIHSEGGSVVEGFRIYDLVAAYAGPKRAVIESAAYSIASFIPMAFDEIEIAPNGYMMLHNPYMGAEGDDEELAAKAEFLAKLKGNMIDAYAKKSGKSIDEVKSILKSESYLNAREVVAAGFADRMTSTPIIGRVFAKLDSMPHGVVSALFGAGSSGDTDSKKGKIMSESVPVAATVNEIEKAYPKASEKFVLSCIRRCLPMASVASAAAEEMMSENEDLKAQVSALAEELELFKAKAMEDEKDPEAKAEESDPEEEEEVAPIAKRKGVAPVAQSRRGSTHSAKVRWNSAVEKAGERTNGNRAKAVALANKHNPGLRQAMLDEVNG